MAKKAQTPVWINGKSSVSLPISDRGLAYGDGVFETVRIHSGQPTLAPLHWCRLNDSCQRLGIVLDVAVLVAEVERFLSQARVDSGVLKIIITRGSGGRGYNPAGCHQTTRCLSLHPLPVRNPDPAIKGAKVMECQLKLGQSALAGMKHLNRLEQVLARAEWQGDEWDEGIVCDFSGHVIEGTMTNLFVVDRNGRLLTPDVSRCGVAGVCRQYIIDKAQKLGLTVEIGDYQLQDVDITELFLCNSVNGVWPVVEYAGQYWDVGPVTLRVRDWLLEELNA